jgi:TolB-like protein/Flp pilus assembly protein TadD
MTGSSPWRALFDELRRRRVFRVTMLYVALGWPAVQLADLMQPVLGVSDDFIRVMLLGFLSGLPLVAALAWIYDLTPMGLVRTGPAEDGSPLPPLLGRRHEIIIIAALLLLSAALFFMQTRIEIWMAAATAPADRAEPVSSRPSPTAAAPQSIAVLPFQTFSDDSSDRYFADGLTEELLNSLSRVRELRVAARTSSFAFRDVNRPVQEIGRELGVRHILEGSVRRSDVSNTVRITAQLIEVETGAHLWSQTYDREFSDVLRIQDDIAGAVVGELQLTLRLASQSPAQGFSTTDPNALIAYGKGREAMAKRRRQTLVQAATHFQEAVARDPGYVEAWAALGETYVLQAAYQVEPRGGAAPLARAEDAIDRALTLDPESGMAWAAQGLLLELRGDLEQARQALQRAIELNPSYANAYLWYGTLQLDREARLPYLEKALELDPRSAVVAANVADTLLDLGYEARAMEMFSRIVEADPLYPMAYMLAGRINEERGRLDEAALSYFRAWTLQPDSGAALKLAAQFLDLGDFDAASTWLERARELSGDSIEAQLDYYEILVRVVAGASPDAGDRLTRAGDYRGQNLQRLLIALDANVLLGRHDAVVEVWETLAESWPALGVDTVAQAYPVVALAYRQRGDVDRGQALLDELTAFLDAPLEPDQRLLPDLWYTRAGAHLLEDEPRLALLALQRAADEGWTEHWRLALDPVMSELRDAPEFDGIVTGLRTRLALIGEQLDGTLREERAQPLFSAR